MQLRFLGGAGTVTGSRYLLESDNHRILVDCGLYQGIKNLRRRNWAPFPVDPRSIDAIVLTHAHIDHSGYLPALVKKGFHGKIYCTRATHELCEIMLPDAAHLQEEDARYANRKKFSKHSPAQPLFTIKDAEHALGFFQSVHYHEPFTPSAPFEVTFTPAGHILGSACARIDVEGQTLVFSGDVGRQEDLVMRSPEPLSKADVLVLESTYGDRRHEEANPEEQLAQIINDTASRGGIVLIPAFAVGRAQSLLYIISRLKQSMAIPDMPVYLNSPMAIAATELFCRHHKEHKLSAEQCAIMDEGTKYVRTVDESIALNKSHYPCIIVSASGMASGGRVLHHLKTLLPHSRNSVVLAGFQAPGTRGDKLARGFDEIKIHGQYFPVKAEVHQINSLSAHGDYEEILTWLGKSQIDPRTVYITHGEPVASDTMRKHVEERFGWNAEVPEVGDVVEI
ncbi:MBL fold metallo-hydrolase [Marinobacteraceae bacterium S3BR75-40.1]